MPTGGGRRPTTVAAASGAARTGWPFSSRSFDQPSKRHSTVPSVGGRGACAAASPAEPMTASTRNNRRMRRSPRPRQWRNTKSCCKTGAASAETPMDDLTLAAEFPAATRDAWLRLVDGVLKGADFEKKLVARSHDGLRIEPLYEKAAPAPQPGRGASGPWRIAQRMDHPDPAAANALALADLDGGADALVFSYAGAAPARGFGVKVETIEDLERALEGVMLDLIAVRIETAPFEGRAAAEQWRAVVERRGVDPAALDIDFGLDPAGDIGRTGEPPMPFKTLAAGMAETTRRLREAGFAGPTARVDTRPYHEAGASEAQELAAALATGVAYLRALEGAGLALAEARRALSFLLVADADEFLTVAKLRARRGSLRPRAGADPAARRDRVAHGDAARRLGQSPARHDRRLLGRNRRRRRRDGAAVHGGARPSRRLRP